MTSSTFGFNDVPADDDLVQVESYLTGLSYFMTICQTPMTIAIQGDWGTGKTSAMRVLKHNLSSNDYWQVDFNTWQYAQFDLGDQLVFSLIGTILSELNARIPTPKSEENEFATNLKKNIKKTERAVKLGLLAAARTAIKSMVPYGEAIVAGLDEAQKTRAEDIDSETSAGGLAEMDASIQLITDLRSSLQQIVQDIVQADPSMHGFRGPNRIIIYIDDLDRLEPERAVAIMEAIKVFLDVPDCVFVLAIDFAVVLRGVREKYGPDFSEDKARAFFDKIIQVPFNLPVGAYNVAELLKTGLESIGLDVSEDELENFDILAQSSAGRNPRSIKRLINTFGLIKTIGKAVLSTDKQSSNNDLANDIHIFAILCLQTAYPDVFSELTRPQSLEGRSEKWNEIIEAATQDSEESRTWRGKFGISEYKEDAFRTFIETVNQLFATKEGKEFNPELFNDALVKSAVTAVGTTETAGATTQTAFRSSAIESLEDRQSALRKTNSHAADLAIIFENVLKEVLGDIQAGVTPAYWSYQASAESRLPSAVIGKRFIELYPRRYGISLMFGNYLTDKAGLDILTEMKHQFPEVATKHSPNSNPRFSIREIKTEDHTRCAARLIAEGYLRNEG
ncbi:KAP family P-loop NTPase fold protein [Boudabousia marimammalium]|uniref:KAP NTPase domain-containing protein n=1 Tax=Boudabousia marimammalium TaxID=156892 RepID=A0A1Q5PL31_9ACTO|nr:P-loop NTPase fold protein [Boudabousia marimammalium]OKL47349.1 hypothetical protein BM477_06685 [Boudabousia marimammalium]